MAGLGQGEADLKEFSIQYIYKERPWGEREVTGVHGEVKLDSGMTPSANPVGVFGTEWQPHAVHAELDFTLHLDQPLDGGHYSGLSNLFVSLGHTGRIRVVLGHTLNTQTLTKTEEQKKKDFKYIFDFVLGNIRNHPRPHVACGPQTGHP